MCDSFGGMAGPGRYGDCAAGASYVEGGYEAGRLVQEEYEDHEEI